MSKPLLIDRDVINIVVSVVIGMILNKSVNMLLVIFACVDPVAKDQYVAIPTDWIDFCRSDVMYEPVNRSNDLPRIIIEVQNKADMSFYQRLIDYSRSATRQCKASTLPIVVAIAIGWASSRLINSETIAPHLNQTPLNPLPALAHCLIEQHASIINFKQYNDPTLISLYTKMKNLLGNNILDNENSIHILKDVRAKSKSECCKSKTALINEDEPVGAQSAYHRAMKKQKQKQTEKIEPVPPPRTRQSSF
ncbi:hypothetical protein MFLAVUS_007939 [Mucor flavus]|uniref:Uncharacterized protein n=1 Tax=Mucor flavus TaxID=439312 RepID=A0ABP9Z5Q2_9FUNG